MKKKTLFPILLLFLFTCSLHCQEIKTCVYIDGYWGEWKSQYGKRVLEGLSELIVCGQSDHPSNYTFKLKIDNPPNSIDKKERKRKIKNKEFYEYKGTIEFFSFYELSTDECINNFFSHLFFAPKNSAKKVVKLPAVIKIYPQKNGTSMYNIFFNGYGLAIAYF